MTKAQNRSDNLADQLVHIEQAQSELELIQRHVLDIVKDPQLYAPPAILIAKLLAGFAVLFFAGIVIGTLL